MTDYLMRVVFFNVLTEECIPAQPDEAGNISVYLPAGTWEMRQPDFEAQVEYINGKRYLRVQAKPGKSLLMGLDPDQWEEYWKRYGKADE